MKFLSGYVWDGSRGEDSLLLQQVRKGKRRILFGCVSSSGGRLDTETVGGYLTGRLRRWFYDKGLALCAGESSDQLVEKELRVAITEILAELEYYHDIKGSEADAGLTGFLAMENRFWLIHSGNSRAYLLNQRFRRPHIRLLTDETQERREEPSIVCGRLQREVGILLCTPVFYGALPEALIRECLNVREIEREIQIERRLGELQQEAFRSISKRAGSERQRAGSALLFKAV